MGTQWKAGIVTNAALNPTSNDMEFYKIEKILPVSTKALDESKGYIIADYQGCLEKEWVDSLRKHYTVQISKAAVASLIKQ